MRLGVFIAAVLAFVPIALADTLVTEDGKTYVGELTRIDGGWVIKQADGALATFTDEQTQSVAKTTGAKSGLESAIASLRKNTEKMTDINEILQRYQNLVKINPQAKDLVKEDIALWQTRKDQKMMKIGDRWMTLGDRRKMLQNLIPLIEKARQKLEKNPKADIAPDLNDIFAIDPAYPAGMYLKAITLLTKGQPVQAKGIFAEILTRVPNHSATLNNLGVIAYRQKSYSQALKYFNQAADKLPASDSIRKTVLDNFAEVLAITPYGARSDDYAKAAERFANADQSLQKKMADQGLYRWGSQWVKKDQMDRINASLDRAQERMDAFDREYDQLRHQLARVNDELSASDIDYRRMFIGKTYYTNEGVVILNQNLSIYRAQQQIRSLQDQQAALLQRLDQFWIRANQAQQDIAGPTYSGETKSIGPEGTPLTLPGGGSLIEK